MTANLFASHGSTRERPGFEIDERAQRSVNNLSAVVGFGFLTNTSIDFTTTRNTVNYDQAATFKGVNLHDELNVTNTSMAIAVSRKLTPLTTASLNFSRQHDRFPFNPIRDSDSTEAGLAVKFDAVALLKGNFTIAYTNLSPLSPDIIPGFSGLTLGANLSYTLYDVTKISFKADRGVRNSYDVTNPYYVQTGFNLEVAQQVMRRLDVVGRGGLERMNYRSRIAGLDPVEEPDAPVALIARTDRMVTYGVGLGYHLGRATRFGINYDKTRRESPIETRRYNRPNIGTSITYDF